MSVELLTAKTPCEIEGRNFRRGYREPQIGKVYTIQFEVDKETWDACELVPKSATVKGVLWWESEGADFVPSVPPPATEEPEKVEDDGYRYNGKKQKAEKPPSGPYAEFWRVMVIKGVKTFPCLQEVLDCTPEHVWDSLHAAFATATMSTVSPRTWEAWVTENGLSEGLITMSRNAEIQAAKV